MNTDRKKRISFVAPCYNEEGNTEIFYNAVKQVIADTGYKYDFEIVFVNDGSRDNTYKELALVHDCDPARITVINFLHNFGKEAAILAGLEVATGDYVCTIDADMQQHPKYTIQMIDIMEERDDIDMVVAKPANQKDDKTLAFFKEKFYKTINAMSDTPFQQGVSDFRTFRHMVCNAIVSLPEHSRFSKGIFSWVCPNVETIEYMVDERANGETKWSFVKLLKYAIEGITSFSHAPLLLPVAVGGIELLLSVMLFLAMGIGAILGNDLNFELYATVAFVLGGLGLNALMLGIIGKYIAKIHTETLGRPHYIIKNILR